MEWMNGNENKAMYSFPNRMWIVTDEEDPKVVAALPRQSIILAEGYKILTSPPEKRKFSIKGLGDSLPPFEASEGTLI